MNTENETQGNNVQPIIQAPVGQIETPQQVVNSSPTRSYPKIWLVVLFVVVILIFSSGGYFLYKQSQSLSACKSCANVVPTKTPPLQPTITPQVTTQTPVATDDAQVVAQILEEPTIDTSSWTLYQNNEDKFSFKYPSKYTLHVTKDTSVAGVAYNFVLLTSETAKVNDVTIPLNLNGSISVDVSSSSGKTLTQFFVPSGVKNPIATYFPVPGGQSGAEEADIAIIHIPSVTPGSPMSLEVYYQRNYRLSNSIYSFFPLITILGSKPSTQLLDSEQVARTLRFWK